jgi:hypothetical protein
MEWMVTFVPARSASVGDGTTTASLFIPSTHCFHWLISLTNASIESFGAVISVALDTTTVEGNKSPTQVTTAKRITMLKTANLMKRMYEFELLKKVMQYKSATQLKLNSCCVAGYIKLFPPENLVHQEIDAHSPDAYNANVLPAIQ